jgi:hypothetical protein
MNTIDDLLKGPEAVFGLLLRRLVDKNEPAYLSNAA